MHSLLEEVSKAHAAVQFITEYEVKLLYTTFIVIKESVKRRRLNSLCIFIRKTSP